MARSQRATRVPGVQTHDRRFRRARGRGEQTSRQVWSARVWRASKIGVLTSAVVWAAIFGYTAVTASAWFSVQDIRVRGNDRLSTGEVSMLLDGLRGSNVVLAALDPWRDRLLGSPWVKDAALRRVLPDVVDVTILERDAVAIVRAGRSLFLMDADGVTIDEYGPRYASLDLPIVEGLRIDVEAPAADAPRTLALAALDDLGGAGLLWRVSQLDVSRTRDVVVTMTDDPTLLHLGDVKFAERLQSYIDMSRRLQAMTSELEYVDLRFEDRVYLRPREQGATFQQTVVAPRPVAEVDDVADVLEGDVIPDEDTSGQE